MLVARYFSRVRRRVNSLSEIDRKYVSTLELSILSERREKNGKQEKQSIIVRRVNIHHKKKQFENEKHQY